MTIQSDIPIPRVTDIISRALDYRASAVRQGDRAATHQLDRLIAKLPSARLCWVLGTLHIDSPSGGHYRITRAGCDCENGQKCRKRQCWHLLAYELLLDIFDTDCDSADMACDPPGDNPLGDEEGDSTPPDRPRQPWYARQCAARTLVWARL